MEIKVEIEDLRKRKLFVATPMYGGWMLTSLFSIPILLFTVIEAAIRCTDSLITGSSDFSLAFMLLVLYNAVFVTGGAWLSEISE